MSPQRITRAVVVAGCAAVLVLAVAVAASDAALEIRHSLSARYQAELTRAYEACVAPNDTASGGIPACNPPVTSACDY